MTVGPVGNLSDQPRIVTVAIAAATESAPFLLSGKINFAHLSSTPGGIRTLKLQFSINGSDWVDTGVSIATSASLPVIWDSNTLAAIAGLCGFKGNLRLTLSTSDTITASFFSRG